jgi:hypothetical protein
MMDNILLIALLLLTASFFLWLAVRVKRHPEKDDSMKKVMAEQRGTEYEEGMQNFFMVNYLSTGLAWVLAAVLEVFFDMKSFPSMLISATGLCLVLVIAKLRFTGEFSKAGFVTFAIGLAIIVAYFIVN